MTNGNGGCGRRATPRGAGSGGAANTPVEAVKEARALALAMSARPMGVIGARFNCSGA
jgi:hypothetical protein